MKITPLLLFLLLLVVLVLAVITLRTPISLEPEKEGFVQFQANVVPQTEVKIPAYSSRSVVKLYDNLFFDRTNANVIEVCGSEFVGNIDSKYVVTKGNVDLTGQTVSAINIKTRDGTISNYSVSGTDVKETTESKTSSITGSYQITPFYTTNCKTTASYQMFYIPWNTDTYIHTIQLTASPSDPISGSFKPKNVFTYRVPSDITKNINASLYDNNLVTITTSSSTNDTKTNKLVTEPLYSATAQVYQLSPDVKYNAKNGDLIVNANNSILVYDRTGKSTTYTSAPSNITTSITDVPFAPWIINNSTNTIQILYVQSSKNTLVALFRSDTIGRYVLLNCGRFNENSIDDGTTTLSFTPNIPNMPNIPIGPPGPGPNMDPSAIADYYKWYWYWNSAGPGTNPQYSNEYMLKTQIVPPVCPSCPSVSCNSSNATSSTSGNTSSTSTSGTGSKTDSAGNVINNTVDSTGNVINKTVDTAGNIVNKTLDTTSNLLTSGASGATNLLTSGASGATNLLTSGASGATNLLRDAGSGAVGIIGKTLDTTGNVLGGLTQSNVQGGAGAYYGGLNTQPNASGVPGFSKGNPPNDTYSYYGALANKGANYIPITADFSAFKK